MLHLFDPLSAMHAIYVLWVLWLASWLVAAAFAARTVKRSPWITAPVIAIVVLFLGVRVYLGGAFLTQLWHMPEAARWALAAVVLVGFAFAWWARITLGRLWSGAVTLKEGHRIIDTGPYALVRHPIYTGLLLSFFAMVAAQGSLVAVAVAVVTFVAVLFKARAEERFLSQELGQEAYAAYRRRVPMLVPFWPGRT